MSITFDNATYQTDGVSQSVLTFSHTVGTGSNRLLIVGIEGQTTYDILSSVTYAGTAMTLVGKALSPGDRWGYMFYLLNPSSGANNVVVTFSSSTYCGAVASSYTGVLQSGQPDASTTSTGTGVTSKTTTLTTIANNSWTILFVKASATPVASTGSTLRGGTAVSGYGLFDSNGPITPAGSTSMTVTFGSSVPCATIMGSFSPLSSYSGKGNFFDFF